PSYGRVSRYGLIAYASSFDQIGVFSNRLEELVLATEIMAGPDEFDNTVIRKEPGSYAIETVCAKKRIAYIEEIHNMDGIDPEIKAKLDSCLEQLKAAGHEVAPVS